MADNNSLPIKIGVAFFGLVALLLVILLPMSFSSLEYYEYGFKRQKSTGRVDLAKVYTGGRHFIGPDFEFKTFKASSHQVTLYRIEVFTQEKLPVVITCSFQYFLRKRDLALLHQAYDVHYEDVMKSSAVDAVKGALNTFDTRAMFEKRQLVEQKLFKAVRERLGGTCCPDFCSLLEEGCPRDCKSGADCTDELKGIYADVRYFQLGTVDVPSTVEEKYLKKLTLDEDTLRETLYQRATIVREKTDQMVRNIKNQAIEVRQNAESEAQLLQVVSRANYTSMVVKARATGLKQLYSGIGITKQEHKNSFDYLRTLNGLDNIHLTVDFQQRIAGSFN